MANEYELTFQDFLSIIRRRAIYLIGFFIVGLLIAVAIAIVIPPTYRATGTIMVESQQIPDNVVPDAIRNQLDNEINVIKQRVLTRENLLLIANKYALFKNDNIATPITSELIDKLRSRIAVEPVSSISAMFSSRQGQQAVAFTVSFEDQHPEIALHVANDLISLFLDWNVRLRTEGAKETTGFLAQESNRLKTEVERLEKLIAAYKHQNSNALPEQLTLRMTMLGRAENDLREVERDYRSTKEDLRSLEVELSAAKQGTVAEENPTQTLPALKAELARLSANYTETHPDIRRLKLKIEAMEKAANLPESGTASTDVTSPAVFRIQAKIESDNARLSSLAQQRDILQGKINENESAMIQTPKVGQGLDELIRDRDIAQKKYEEIRGKKMNAQIAENLESDNKSERFSLLEPIVLPEKPIKNGRLKIFAIGLFLAIGCSGGAVAVLELIDKRIRGTEAITHVLGYQPLATIPYIQTLEEVAHRKRVFLLAIIASVSALIISTLALRFL